MRILFTFVGGSGHFNPLVPIARAAQASGHVVAVAGRPGMVPSIVAVGFSAFATGPDVSDTDRMPLLEPSAEREDRVLREGFAGRTARERATAILSICDEWRPDLLVCDEIDFGAMVASERLGLPHATVLVIATGSFVRPEIVAEPLNALRAEHGLVPDPDLAMLSRHLVLSPFPPSFRDPAFPLPATAHSFRPLDPSPDEPAPPWLERLGEAPTVYLTLGTVFNVESGDLFTRAIAGLRDLPIELVVTVGRQIDPAEFGPQPANVHIERYIPQSMLLSHCDLVLSHGGSGSVMGALEHGLPMVLLPMGADQMLNAARCRDLGVARVLDAVTAAPEAIGEAVSVLLAGGSYRKRAERIRDEIAVLPGVTHAVALLEALQAAGI